MSDERLRELERRWHEAGTLEAMATGASGLEPILEAATSADASPSLAERLVHLPRYKRGLETIDADALSEPDARTLARTLRDQVTGATLGGGLVLVLQELCAAGLAATRGLEAVAWLPDLLG